jgi:hypothetical protein
VNLAEVSLVFLTCSRQKPEDFEKIFATLEESGGALYC